MHPTDIKVKRHREQEDIEPLPYVCHCNNIVGIDIEFSTDQPLSDEEQYLLSSVLVWSRIDEGTLNAKAWDAYVNNKAYTPPDGDTDWARDDGEWTLDFWEMLFNFTDYD